MPSSVSVLVPTYNRAHFIEESLDSLVGQTIAPAQIIVIDDGSTDGTAERVRKYGERITYLRKENGGRASALNLGMKHVTGDLVWTFDDDDVAYPDAIARHLEVLAANPELGFTCSSYASGKSGPDGTIAFERLMPVRKREGRQVFLELMKDCFFMLNGAIVRRECYRRAGEFREDMIRGQDYDMLVRLARLYPCKIIDGATYILRQHPGRRGSAAENHAESERHKVWRAYDKIIGARIRNELDLGEYLLAVPAGPLSAAQRREALLSRASVMASKGLLREMFEDLEAAAAVPGAPGPITDAERAIAFTFCVHNSFVHEASRLPGFLRRLCALARSPFGAGVVSAIGRSFYWELRNPKGREGHVLWLIKAAATVLPVSGARELGRAGRRNSAAPAESPVRPSLPVHASGHESPHVRDSSDAK